MKGRDAAAAVDQKGLDAAAAGGHKGPAVVTESQCRYKGVLFRFVTLWEFLNCDSLIPLKYCGGGWIVMRSAQ